MVRVREQFIGPLVWRVGLLVAAVALTACGSASSTSIGSVGSVPGRQDRATVTTRDVADLGTVLVDANGYALYMFPPDHQHEVTCTGACAGTWPPVLLTPGQQPAGGPGINPALLSSLPNPEGGQVATYNGWPLYTYAGDTVPGQITGQALDLNGGYWYLMRPTGEIITAPGPAGY